MDSNEMLCRPH